MVLIPLCRHIQAPGPGLAGFSDRSCAGPGTYVCTRRRLLVRHRRGVPVGEQRRCGRGGVGPAKPRAGRGPSLAAGRPGAAGIMTRMH
jgi:hypothetical protein